MVEQQEVLAMPTTVFIDGEGQIFQKRIGALNRGMVTQLAPAMPDWELSKRPRRGLE